MRRSLLTAALLLLAAPTTAAQESCAVCHGDLALTEFAGAHAAAGVSCVDCHGGVAGALDAAEAHGPDLFVARDPRESVQHCGGCHADFDAMRGFGMRTDQLRLYESSQHGQRLAEANDPNVATCVSCHGAHGVLPSTDPNSPMHPRRQPETCGACHGDAELMGRYGLSAEPPALYRDSVHGHALLEYGSLSSPSCATCHGAHGAVPPRVEEVGRVCGHCHTAALHRFEAGPHRDAVIAGAMDECTSCHGSHAVARPSTEMLIGGGQGACGSCHMNDAAVTGVGRALYDMLRGFDDELAAAEAALADATERGVFVEREADLLAEARGIRRRAAPVVHAISAEALDGVLERGRGMVARTVEGLEREENVVRSRKIFVFAFLLVDLLLVAALLIQSREVAGHRGGGGRA